MNKDNYKKVMDKIHASDELKNKTFNKIVEAKKPRKVVQFRKFIAACAAVMIVFGVVTFYVGKQNNEPKNIIVDDNKSISKTKNDLPRFKNIAQLKEVLKKNNNNARKSITNGIDITMTDGIAQEEKSSSSDYSNTNVQVDNVDESDIVKTDGEFIYYVTKGSVYIVNAQELKIVSKMEVNEDKEKFNPCEIYVNSNKLIVLGNSNSYEGRSTQTSKTGIVSDEASIDSKNMAKAMVYDISNKNKPEKKREVALDGYYSNSRMIGENVYFISTKGAYYNNRIKDDDILPLVKDTATMEEEKRVECTDIAYFKDTESCSYMLVTGFNINNNEEASFETFFGANDTVYSSENNMYIAQTMYDDYSHTKSTIYKFNLKDSNIVLQCKGEVKGDLNNQFSMDEFEGNLRIATTDGYNESSENQLYVLDENLKEIGKIENLAKGEKIYSVRFMGKIGYIVTFEQIDPLFVIDLSNPEKPEIKGELKIPGYSSYMHPYDETHIIGIGYNTKSNGYGGVTNSNMKMSMFDVSDLENPKEMFNIDIGSDYAYSEITSNHKSLFYNKNKNLIGFPVTYRERSAKKDRNGFTIFKINLDTGFEKYGEILQEIDYKTNIERAIYIRDTLYTLSETKIISYELEALNKIAELEIE